MSITVVPTLALKSAGNASTAAATSGAVADDQAPADFSSLLAGQIFNGSLGKQIPGVDQLSVTDQLSLLTEGNSKQKSKDKPATEKIEGADTDPTGSSAFFDNLFPHTSKNQGTNHDLFSDLETRRRASMGKSTKVDDSVIAFNAGAIIANTTPLGTASGTDSKNLFSTQNGESSLSQISEADDTLVLDASKADNIKTMLGQNDKPLAMPTDATTRPLTADLLTGNNEPAKVAGDASQNAGTNFASALAAQEKLHGNVATRTDNSQSVAVPFNDPRWAQQMGERVVWLARGDVQSAQINITPPQMGPIQINIKMNGDQMSAQFVAVNPEVRQALDDAMPRLREMLSGAGINLGQANVGSQTPQQQQQQSQAQFGQTPRLTGEDAILSVDKPMGSNLAHQPTQRGRGMVDLFA